MNATDELRRMLDKAGVEWHDDGYATTCTVWTANGITWHGLWRDGSIELLAHHLTPAQAIAATLGPATCHLEEIEKDCDTASEYMLEREWCFDAVYRCSCGCRFGHVAHNRPRFCPNCGAKVVGA